jgi:2-polyprenyl-3-methyl-5-hydroxy-6-metoxy-1,4-benzoquinol methylase
MEEWKKLEFSYAKRLRECNAQERKKLYFEAYSVVSKLGAKEFSSDNPEERTAGTSKEFVQLLSHMVDKEQRVLEIGCGRGYTCLKLAPYIMSMVGIEVSESAIIESKELLSKNKIKNIEIRQISAIELKDNFNKNEFDTCISIELIEHLHPEDAKEHLKQVFLVLKPGGKYIINMPNRLSGPHDITKEEFPDEKKALGFHLNESTYKEMINIMRSIGFNRFKVFYPIKTSKKDVRPFIAPYQLGFASEILFENIPNLFRHNILKKLLSINIVAYKPLTRE